VAGRNDDGRSYFNRRVRDATLDTHHAHALRLVQVTEWLRSNAIIECQYGRVIVLVWLELECERIIEYPGRRAAIARMGPSTEWISLWVDEPPALVEKPLGRLHKPGPPKMR